MFDTTHLHPMMVHFPIALLVLGFFAELLGIACKKQVYMPNISLYLQITGTLGAIAAVITGNFFTLEVKGAAEEILETHENFANITMWIMIVATALRLFLIYKKKEEGPLKWFVFALYGLGTLSVLATGFYGGTLVYDYFIGGF